MHTIAGVFAEPDDARLLQQQVAIYDAGMELNTFSKSVSSALHKYPAGGKHTR